MLDDGILTIYKKTPRSSDMGSLKEELVLHGTGWYGEINFHVSEYYLSKQEQIKVDKRVRIHQDKRITNLHVVVIDDVQYNVGRIYHGIERGILITDLSLERVKNGYDIT